MQRNQLTLKCLQLPLEFFAVNPLKGRDVNWLHFAIEV